MKSYFEIAGDGGSGIAAQVAELKRRVTTALSGVRCRLAIGSGKGGVGKSTLTRHLAGALRQRGHRVAVLDADLNGPTQARLAGVRGAPPIPGERGLRLPLSADGIGVVSLGAFIPENEAVEFESAASGGSHVWRATREFTLLAELLGSVEWGELDYLLFDLAPGAERTFQYAEFLGPETAFLLVTLPSELARGVVARSVAALAEVPNPVLGYVENMSGYYCADCDAVKPLFPRAGEVELPIPCLGRLAFDPELAALCDRGLPSSAGVESPLTRSLAEIADRVARATSTLEKTR